MERRARRLVPAMVPVLVATWLAGYFLFLPDPFKDLSKSIVMLCLFAVNHYFLSATGYFDANDLMPLLHTWSLSVEEQFYLSFSLTVLAVLKWMPRRLQLVLVALAVLSFATAVALMETGQHSAAFYLAVSRFWEFLIGSWLALGCLPKPNARWGVICRGTGLIMIGCAVFLFDANTPFPGLAALLPTVGAALVIFAGNGPESDFLYRLLASRGAVHLGKISYSLYLWHWPLLVYAGIFAHVLPDWYRAPVVGLSFVLAGWSFRYVERPFRKRIWLPRRTQVLAATVGVATALLAGSGWVVKTKGLPSRLPAEVQKVLSYGDPFKDPLIETCSSFERVEFRRSLPTWRRKPAEDRLRGVG